MNSSGLENVTTEYIQWDDVVKDGWKLATTNRNSYCYPKNMVSRNSMRNTYIIEDTLEYYQQPVKFDQDSG